MSCRWFGLLGVAVLVAACGGDDIPTEEAASPQRPVVLVSGRDDHGLLATERVALADEPDGPARRFVADGTLAAVITTRGEWLELRALTGPNRRGWVNDFYLRGVVHLRAPDDQCRVPLLDRPAGTVRASAQANAQATLQRVVHANGQTWVRVELTGDDDGWVTAGAVHELPGDHVAEPPTRDVDFTGRPACGQATFRSPP